MLDSLLAAHPVYRWLTTAILVGTIVILSITPGIERPGNSIFGWLVANTATPIQKALHVAAYAALAFAWMWTLATIESVTIRIAVALVLSIGLGAALEACQTRVPGRFGTVLDALLNAVGSMTGVIVALMLL